MNINWSFLKKRYDKKVDNIKKCVTIIFVTHCDTLCYKCRKLENTMKKNKEQFITIRVNKTLKEKITKMSEAEQDTISNVVRKIIEKEINTKK